MYIRGDRMPRIFVRGYDRKKIKTPPLAAKRNGGAGTEKRPYHLFSMITAFPPLSIAARKIFFRSGTNRGHAAPHV
jgi:hypothetical protein